MKRYSLHPAPVEALPGLSAEFAKHLNPEQLRAVLEGDGASLVLAGAGSGKTRTLIYRVLHLVNQGIAPDKILLVTFTNKAAGEMKRRMESHLGAEWHGLWCGTFHHIAHRLLRQHASDLGLAANFTILDEEDARILLKSCFPQERAKPRDSILPQPSLLQAIGSLQRNLGLPLPVVLERKYPHFLPVETEIHKVLLSYAAKKKESHLLDFDDLLCVWLAGLKADGPFSRAIRARFDYCCVDEYQDINPLQNRIIEALVTGSKNLMVVGDDAQSIYSFRGADVESILQFPERFPETHIFRLETNYRSTPEILALANDSIRHNRRQFPKSLRAVREPADLPALVRVRDLRDQSLFVTQRLTDLTREGLRLDQIAVLFRARFQAAELELELARRGIPYVLRGGVRFFEQAHIKDVLSHIKVLHAPADEVAWQRALMLYPGIGPATSQELWSEYRGLLGKHPADEVWGAELGFHKVPARADKSWRAFRALMKNLAAHKTGRPDALITRVVEGGYGQLLKTRFENAQDRMDDLAELANFAHTYTGTEDFLSDIALRENFRGESFVSGAGVEDSSKLILSTIHQAKGLEWDAVFVIGLAEGQFPHYLSTEEAALEEERRLFYVAVTRAKNHLFLVHPMTRYDRQLGTVINRTSQFTEELNPSLFEEFEAVADAAPSASSSASTDSHEITLEDEDEF